MKALFTILLAMLVTGMAYSQPGTLDLTFGINGFVADTEGISGHYAILQQSNGKLVTAGGYNDKDFNGKGNLARYLHDGTLDSSFGNNGFAGYPPGGGINDMIKQPDGKILVVGLLFIDLDNNIERSFVARFKPDGTYDSSFGKNGFSFIPDFGDNSGYLQIALETDGSMVINGAGSAINSQASKPSYSLLCHLFPDGTFDYSFGNGGRTLNASLINYNYSGALAIQPDGKILQAGFNGMHNEGQDYVLCRYNPNGALDNTFGGGVVITHGTDGEDVPTGLLVQPDGRIVMGGYSHGDTYYMTAIRYNEDGSLDNSFGKEGKSFVLFPGSLAYAYELLRQPDGKLILAGDAGQASGGGFALCRLDTDGSIDSSFAVNGREVALYPDIAGIFGYCAALQSDGKIAVGGYYYDDNYNPHSLLARFNGDGSKKQIIVTKIKRWLQHHGITWQMDNSIRYYNVQRSQDGGVTYQPVAKIYNNHQLQYNYEDAAGKSNDLYRVAAVGKDGSRSYSNSVLISSESSVSVFPNPVRSTMQLQGLSTESKTNISIVDFTGNVRTTATANSSSCSINTSNLQPGNYFIKIESNKTITTQPFVKE